MNEEYKVRAIIPARKGSKGVPSKNHRDLAGKPLICWTIEHALSIDIIDEIIITTDDKVIKEISKGYDITVIDRPKHLSEDDSLVVDAIRHVLEIIQDRVNFNDVIIMMEPTCPFRRDSDTKKCIELVSNKNSFDCAATYRKALLHPERAWVINSYEATTFLKESSIWRSSNRQSLSNAYQSLGTYAFNASGIGEYFVLSGRIGAVIVHEKFCIDLDDEYDFIRGEIMLKDLINNE